MKTNQKKTIAMIAQECGVSAMTVSRALRNHPSVKDETRLQIIEKAESLGYCHSIKTGRPPTKEGKVSRPYIELILGAKDKSVVLFYSELLTVIERELAAKGYDCVVRTCNSGYNNFLELRSTLRNSLAHGVIVTGAFTQEEIKALFDLESNLVLLDNPGDGSMGTLYNSISFDNAEAARIAVRHLHDIGRKKILLVTGPSGHYFSREIEQGYREALFVAGIEVNTDYILRSDFSSTGAFEVVSQALGEKIEFDAVFTNDEMALGVYRALNKYGICIPADVAVCGCDGIPVGEQIAPTLTTVVLDYREMGKMAVERVLSDRSSKKPCRIKLLPEKLCIRESTSLN